MKKYFTLLLLFSSSLAFSQTNGIGLWTGLEVEKKINKHFSIMANGQARFAENVSFAQNYLGEIGLTYKPIKNLEISGYYRFIHRRKNEEKSFKNRHRFYSDLAYKHKIGILKVEYRLRYQHQFKDNIEESSFDTSYIRNKLELSYPNKSRFTPAISADLFYEVNGKFDQLRPRIGFTTRLNKRNSLDASVFSNLDLINKINSSPIIRLNYKLKI